MFAWPYPCLLIRTDLNFEPRVLLERISQWLSIALIVLYLTNLLGEGLGKMDSRENSQNRIPPSFRSDKRR